MSKSKTQLQKPLSQEADILFHLHCSDHKKENKKNNTCHGWEHYIQKALKGEDPNEVFGFCITNCRFSRFEFVPIKERTNPRILEEIKNTLRYVKFEEEENAKKRKES